VRVTRGKRTLNVLSAGDCFGEMCYLSQNGTHRSATETTTSDAIVMKIRAEDLRNASLPWPPPLRRALPRHAGAALELANSSSR
jgi:CRP-like cAMP-binding protein